MNADAFVVRLHECSPNVESIVACGVPRDAAERFCAKYEPLQRISGKKDSDALLDLIARYHAESIEIGMVRFLSSAEATPVGWQVAKAESDPLVLNRMTGQIEVRDLSDLDFVIWTCAANSERFLDAMAIAACFLSDVSGDRARAQDNVVLYDAALRCAAAAGGTTYSNFYEMLLGCDVG